MKYLALALILLCGCGEASARNIEYYLKKTKNSYLEAMKSCYEMGFNCGQMKERTRRRNPDSKFDPCEEFKKACYK